MCYDGSVMDRNLILENAHIRVEPLGTRHLAALGETANDPALWEFTFQRNPFDDAQRAQAWLREAMEMPDAVAFAIVDRESGEICGSTRYFDIDPRNRKLEIGWTFIARKWWRTHVNAQTKALLLEYAFEKWNAVRVQFKAEAVNLRSHRAILRLGATHEGTLRNFRIRPGTGERRDVAIYSILDTEWPAVKARLTFG